MPFSDATVSREAEKVQAWYADAQQRAAGGEDTSQLLMASLEADIQQEIQRASARLKGGSGASSRLYQDAQRRAHKAASHPAFESSAGSLVQYASALSFEERSAVQARNAELLEGMEARKKAEASSLNMKVGVRDMPTLFRVGKPSAALPDKTYQELLYEEGMLGKEERNKWREESIHLLSACEQQQCTFHPSLNAHSVDLTRGRPKLFDSTTQVLEAHRARRAALEDQLRLREEATLSAPNAGSPGPGVRPGSPARGGKAAGGGKAAAGRPASAECRRTAEEVVADLCWRGQEMRQRKQQARADVESKYRVEETFSPFINQGKRGGAGEVGTPSPPAHERLYARAPASPPHSVRLSAGRNGSPATGRHLPHSQGKQQSPLSAQQQQRSEQMHAVAATHRARHDARTRAAHGAARRAAASPKVDSRSRRLAFSKATRELQALFDAAAPSCGAGLSPSQLHAVLSSMGLVRPAGQHTVYPPYKSYPKAQPATQLDPHPEIDPERRTAIDTELHSDADLELPLRLDLELESFSCRSVEAGAVPDKAAEAEAGIKEEGCELSASAANPPPLPASPCRSPLPIRWSADMTPPPVEAVAPPLAIELLTPMSVATPPPAVEAVTPPPAGGASGGVSSPPSLAMLVEDAALMSPLTPPRSLDADDSAPSPASVALLAEDAALVSQLHWALVDETETVPFERVAALLLGSAPPRGTPLGTPTSPDGAPLSIPADLASQLRLSAKSVRRRQPPNPSTEEAQLADFPFHPATSESAASFAELYSATNGSIDGGGDAALAGSPLGLRAGRAAAGETVFEQLYTRAAQMRSNKERLRAQVRQREMGECTFWPDVSKCELSQLESEHQLRASRWDRLQRLSARASR